MVRQMVVSIRFLGKQHLLTRTDSIDMPITENTRVNDAVEYVRNRYPQLHLEEGMVLVAVNQEVAPPDRLLRANDSILFLPFICGG